MKSSYYTQATNFISASSEDVDPRTRLFGFNHALTDIVGNNGMGPSLNLTMTYSATSSDNSWAMGIGMLLTMTWYDKNSHTLYLNSGESFKIDESSDGSPSPYFDAKQCKITTFKAEKFDDGNNIWYRITDRDGSLTDLHDVGGQLFRPQTLWSPLGHRLNLSWSNDGGNPYLSKVTDDLGSILFSAVYSANNGAPVMTLLPGTSEEQTISLYTGNGYLTSMQNAALLDTTGKPADWQFEYKNVGISGLNTLYKITMPTGLVKEVIYNDDSTIGLMLFPDEAGLPPLPAVTKLTVSPGQGQPDIVTTWSFINGENTNPNYLGYGGQLGVEWSDDTDVCYTLLDTNYVYQTVASQEAVDKESNAIKVVYSYNNYHLLLSSVTTQGNTSYEVATTYYAIPGETFDNQPAQFQYPKLQSTTWTDGSGTFVERTGYEYDEYGNLTKQISWCDDKGQPTTPSMVTESVFYSATGEGDSADEFTGCPADPGGFVRWLKSQTVTPPVVNNYQDVPTRTSYYRYQSLITLNSMPVTSAVLPAQESHTASDVLTPSGLLLTRTISYENDTASVNYGRTLQQQVTVYDINDKSGKTSYIQTLGTQWQTSGAALQQTDTLTTHDNKTVTTSLSRSRFSHQLWSVTDSLNNTIEMTYDLLGRLTSQTQNKGTNYQATVQHSYLLEKNSGVVTAISTIATDDKGNAVRTDHDGMGRPVTHQRNANDSGQPDIWCATEKLEWDSWGRLASQTGQDFSDPTGVSPSFMVSSQAQFDDWGQQVLSIISTGQNYSHVWDPIKRNAIYQTIVADTQQTLKLGSQKIEYDEVNLKQTTTLLDQNSATYAVTVDEYDGLGRLRKVTDPLQHVTTFTYDEFDRMASKTLPDNSVQLWSYAPFSYASLPTTIALNGKVMGTQNFDGLGRMLGNACGGRSESAVFTGSNLVPDSTTNAAGQVLEYSYINELGNALSGVAGNILAQNFSYENSTGRLLSASEKGSQSETQTWWPSGLLQGESITPLSGNTKQTLYSWTLQGSPLSYQDIASNTLNVGYDSYGRVQTLTDPLVKVTLTRDDAGRLIGQEVASLSSSDTLLTTLTLDDFSREVGRNITPSTGDALNITQSWYPNGQLCTRTTTQSGTVLRDESFAYDERNRLIDYTCKTCDSCPDANLPVDAYGNKISALHFTLDAYSNITVCKTTLSDGSIDLANYQFENQDDPCQLTSVTHTLTSCYPASIILTYDANGRMITDEVGRTLTYDEAGRLATISGTDGNSQYGYDAFDKLVMQSLNSSQTRQLYYQGDRLMNEVNVEQSQCTRFIPGVWGTSAVSDETLS